MTGTTTTATALPGRTGERDGRWAVAGASVVVLAGSLAQLAWALGVPVEALDSSRDGGAFGVVGDAVLAAAAGVAWWSVLPSGRPRPAAVLLPPLLTVLAVDKALRLHDHVPHYLQLYGPVLLGAAGCLVTVAGHLPSRHARLVVTGLGLLAASLALHVGGQRALELLDLDGSGWAHQLKAVVKHGCEVEGWALVAIGLAAARRTWRPRHER